MFLPNPASAHEDVILLHGLCRTSHSMAKMEKALTAAGYRVRNVCYPSQSCSVEELSDTAVANAVADCEKDGATKIHFVTHSLGGILVRNYLAQHDVPSLGRVVMLAPPNQGSELVDKLGSTPLFKFVCGPAGKELGTHDDSICHKLGAANFDFGVIAGNRSVNFIESLLIPGRDDGKVAVEKTKLEGMADHIVIHTSHPFIMRNRVVIEQSVEFLRTGEFARPDLRL